MAEKKGTRKSVLQKRLSYIPLSKSLSSTAFSQEASSSNAIAQFPKSCSCNCWDIWKIRPIYNQPKQTTWEAMVLFLDKQCYNVLGKTVEHNNFDSGEK